MSIFVSLLLVQAAAAATPTETGNVETAPAKSSKICRDMLTSSSRLRPIRVCKTKAGWERWQRCHSATRYCAPPKRQTVAVVSLPDEKLVCKYLKTTGSRLEQQKVCATRRQWELTELEAQETMRDRQNRSTLTSEGATGGRNFTPLSGPQ